jgi:hypothetical protein
MFIVFILFYKETLMHPTLDEYVWLVELCLLKYVQALTFGTCECDLVWK